MTGRTQTLPWWLEGEGVKTTEKQNTLAPLGCKNWIFWKTRNGSRTKSSDRPFLYRKWWNTHAGTSLKGVWHEIFSFTFFSWIIFPRTPEYPIRTISIFSKVRGDIREWRFLSGVKDSVDKREKWGIIFSYFVKSLVQGTLHLKIGFFAYFSFLGVGKLILAGLSFAGVNDTGEKFLGGVIDIGEQTPFNSLIVNPSFW